MKTSILFSAVLIAASAYAQVPQEATRVIVHSKGGETKVYKFSELDYIDFKTINDRSAEISIVEGSLKHNEVTVSVKVTEDCDHYTIDYNPVMANVETLPGEFKGDAEIKIQNLMAETEYQVMVTPYDKYGLVGETASVNFTTPEEIVETNAKVGDYFYSDGTWSDGGLISIDADGQNAVWSATKPAPVSGKTVIGIVCSTDPSRIAPEDLEAGYTHGYVISTRNLTDPEKPNYTQYPETVWYGAKFSAGEETKVVKIAKSCYERLSGRDDSAKVLATYPGEESEKCPMFHAANSMVAPANTSGWFVPSVGQLWDCIANFCSGPVAAALKSGRSISYDFTYYFSQELNINVMDLFMKPFELVPDTDKDAITQSDVTSGAKAVSMRTSNRYDEESTIIFNLGNDEKGLLEGMAAWRDEEAHARAFLAF